MAFLTRTTAILMHDVRTFLEAIQVVTGGVLVQPEHTTENAESETLCWTSDP